MSWLPHGTGMGLQTSLKDSHPVNIRETNWSLVAVAPQGPSSSGALWLLKLRKAGPLDPLSVTILMIWQGKIPALSPPGQTHSHL